MTALTNRLNEVERSFSPTPLVSVDDDNVDLHAKLEFCNPTGSVKDRAAFWILKRAVERGEITSSTTVVESSSGNFAIAMSSFCRALGIAFVPVIDPNCNVATEQYLRAACDRVEKVTERDSSGGFLLSRLARVQELEAALPGAYWPNQYANADAAEAHFLLTGGEIAGTLDSLDYVFIGVSTGGTLAGLSQRLKKEFPQVKVIAVDTEGSVIFGRAPRARKLPGLGSSIVPPLVASAEIDDVVIVSEHEAVRGCRALLRRSGLFVGGSTGSTYAAIQRYFAGRGNSTEWPRTLFLCADRGTAYAETVYNNTWVAEALGEETRTPATVAG
ncbi:2,3-diaminopropionate biosynthesis protein SbnA [Lentzea sp. NEAU-D13]|uniref:N-(2-amino-2-carboxyethyl)-L-glutamate synthase n=1 Tax=Lentzea alba TaxID=2714351 RepID=A0A7C9RTL7_9PSEU|nr:2,3-diaminopropionate biosynthesis protein SbnA [Lentzea alba]